MAILKVFSMGLILVGSCVTKSEDTYRKEISGLTDMSLDYIASQWGKADSRIPKGTGAVLKYKKILSVDEDPLTGKLNRKLCVAKLSVNKKGLVTDWVYENCSPIRKTK